MAETVADTPALNALWDAEGWATTAAAAAPAGLRVGNRRLPLHDARLEPGRAAAPAGPPRLTHSVWRDTDRPISGIVRPDPRKT